VRRLSLPGSPPVVVAAATSREASYVQAIESIFTTYRPPGILAGVRVAGEAPWTRAFGQADVARAAPMALSSTFPVRSVTKSFTVTLLLQLVQSGQVALEHKIERYIAGVPNGSLINLVDLARNQSGLADYSMQPGFLEIFVKDTLHVWTPQELVAFSFAGKPPFLPGEQYQYSNTNTVLLGMVVEVVTGQSLADALAARIFKPLGLSCTSYASSADLPPPTPTPYAVDVITGVADDQPLISPTSLAGSGAIASTLADLLVWAMRWVAARSSVRRFRICASRVGETSPTARSTTATAWVSDRSATGGATPAAASDSRSRP